ncbi:MAG: hypothetical protein HZA49_03715 [Planctomycetes bacterium]|nr:hypothetical protein [Planctomycetota bacterium]
MKSFDKPESIIREDVRILKEAGVQTNAYPITVLDGWEFSCYNIVPIVINPAPNVPWQDIVTVINICNKADIGVVFSKRYRFPEDVEDLYEEEEYTGPELTEKEYIKWGDKVKRLEAPRPEVK